MNRGGQVKELLRRTYRSESDGYGQHSMDERILGHASTTMKQAVAANQNIHPILSWRTIMRTKTAKLSTVAAAVILLVAGLLIKGTSTAWSLEQTIAAMKKIETLHISGKDLCHGEQVSFECWVRLPSKGSDGLKMRYQCGCKRKTTIVVQGGTVYRYYPVENVVTTLDGSRIEDLQFWYEGAKLSPWLTGTLIQTLRLFVDDWSQTVETDPDTGRQQILVTCSYPPSNTSFLFVVDPESRLIQRARLWKNLDRQGEPYLDAQVLTYNPEIPDEFFEFKVPPGAMVIDQKEEERKSGPV